MTVLPKPAKRLDVWLGGKAPSELRRVGKLADGWLASFSSPEDCKAGREAIEQVRLLTLKTAWMMDTVGKKAAQTEIAAIKVMAARVATDVIDRAIQLFGGAGVTDDWPLASMYAHARTLHLVDGPDEVHMRQIARRELGKYAHLRPAGF
jgi:alkanesulfonate monooxygenase SsuD/methylene tetrahydromethanopterin reductase-like flavin-dependent oxidoreductase (luciferase family)